MRIGVVGGGLSGLSAGYRAARYCNPCSVKVFESQKEPGGWVKTIKTPSGALLECGPHSIRFKNNDLGSKYAISLMKEIGLNNEIIFRYKNHPSAKYRFMVIDGKVTKFPYSLLSALNFDKIDKLEFAKGMVKDLKVPEDISLHDLMHKRFGEKAAKYLIDPVCRGIFATPAANLTVDNSLPPVKMLKSGRPIQNIRESIKAKKNDPSFLTDPVLEPYFPAQYEMAKRQGAKVWNLQRGLQSLTDRLAEIINEHEECSVEVNTHVHKISKVGSKFEVKTSPNNTSHFHKHHFDQIFSAVSPNLMAKILDPVGFPEKLLLDLEKFEASNVHVYLVEMPKMVLPKEAGFGFLMPTCEDKNILGVIYDSCSFPEHDSFGSRFTVMAREPVDPMEVLSYCIDVCEPLHTYELQASIPLMNKYHLENARRIKNEAKNHGIHLIGNYFNGVSVNECLYHCAQEMQEYFDSRNYMNINFGENTPVNNNETDRLQEAFRIIEQQEKLINELKSKS